MKYISGDAIEVFKNSKSAVLIHQVNCQGVMGSGIAKQIRDTYPNHFDDYKECVDHFGSSEMFGEYFFTMIDSYHSVVGLFSQFNYGTGERHTNYAAFVNAITQLVNSDSDEVDYELIIPKYIGCGLGGGDWNIIEQILLDVEQLYDVEFTCVEYEA
jgi:O-acetyl-ADP-ribose deacetylase (regulator of RNase III)